MYLFACIQISYLHELVGYVSGFLDCFYCIYLIGNMAPIENKIRQAGAELCQELPLPLAWNFALAGAAYSASCG